MMRRDYYWLIGALVIGLLARLPGVFWGYNFPTEWQLHHVDEWTHLVNTEILSAPTAQPQWRPYYPKGLATHVAVPVLALRILTGGIDEPPPPLVTLVVAGRLVSVLYGVATIFVVFLLARRFFRDQRIALIAAWLLALGGLHVTQSHFFLADVPSLFWFLLGLYLLFRELQGETSQKQYFLVAAAFCFGVSFGVKFQIMSLPVLGIVTLMSRPRIPRIIYAGVFFFTGFIVVNFASYTPEDLYLSLTRGINDPYIYNRFMGLMLYAIELPSLVSYPILLLAVISGILLLGRVRGMAFRDRLLPILLVTIVPMVIYFFLVAFKLDHFPRHLIPFIPWIMIVAAWGVVKVMDRLTARGLSPALFLVPLFLYMGLFVFDGERVFLDEPRNRAAEWILTHVESEQPPFWRTPGKLDGYSYVHFPEEGRPPVLVMQMDRANHYLSGVDFRESYPRDYRTIFDSESQARVDGIQAVFQGTSEYQEVARFDEGYFMPEYRMSDRLLGNRSRNYVAEIVVFQNTNESSNALP
ncbi:glycosyltransferase family 39 protein [Chloroflexi bacterium TSY]|nr:glycosyltransferase family 39 protein [Chloroflexi bacterium TSY]